MNVNADFFLRVAVHAADAPWVPSPMPGVDRRMLDRIGGEVARATTVVRYAPHSRFSAHVHTGGEEYLVLDGVFQDEHGDFPIGTYVRNPPGSRHTPRADNGATILVKLWQFDPSDRTQVVIPSTDRQPTATDCDGVEQIALYEDSHERVRIELWQPDTKVQLAGHQGMEVFVVAGGFTEAGEEFGPNDWLRLPAGHVSNALAGKDGARLWIKSGHLAQTPKAPRP
ncbi:MAG TPA: cupin domain-containing protein [Albidovulum sp.]|uniref:cupin domain-containing protein n=1 Tax=Albidovulum sp. TaxID=1872424 RepID=UPI002C7E6C89|nr:cupin domain-containing protein [Albidovulum sp.]